MLRSLVLTNFKAFDDIELPLNALTLLSGLNGSGKSSVLQALGLLRQSFDSGSMAAGSLDLNGPLVQIGTGRDLLHQEFDGPSISIILSTDTPAGIGTMAWHAEPGTEADVLSCGTGSNPAPEPGCNLFAPGFQYLRADRITPSLTFPRSQHSIESSRFLGARGEYAGHFLQRYGIDLQVPDALRHRTQRDAASLDAQVNGWMQDFSPGVRVAVDAIPMTDSVRLTYSYQGRQSAFSDPMRSTNVGFGLTHVLPVLTACLAAGPGTLVMIENPEAQLHPRGQVAMGRLLAITAAGGVQVIVETHSDHLLNGIRLTVKERGLEPDRATLHFFSRDPGQATIHDTPVLGPDGRLSFWPEGFFDEWERSLNKLLA